MQTEKLDTCAIYNAAKPAIDVTVTEDLGLVLTYMSNLRIFSEKLSSDAIDQTAKFPIVVRGEGDGQISLYLRHGRAKDEVLDDWGSDGPTFPCQMIVIGEQMLTLYQADGSKLELVIDGDLVQHGDVFYGDLDVNFVKEVADANPNV